VAPHPAPVIFPTDTNTSNIMASRKDFLALATSNISYPPTAYPELQNPQLLPHLCPT